MRIISWNVNGLGTRLEAVKRLVVEYEPDVICCQKTRSKGGGFFHQIDGYLGFLGNLDEPLFGGITTFVRHGIEVKPIVYQCDAQGWLDNSGNFQSFDFGRFILINAYFPYANAANEKWLQIRRQWNYQLHEYLETLSKVKPLIVCGDMNIVREDADAWDGLSVKNAGCFYPWEHKDFDSMMAQCQLVDSYRALHSKGREFTYFFQNQSDYRAANQGFRIDYFLVSQGLMPDVLVSEILTDVVETTNNPILLDVDV